MRQTIDETRFRELTRPLVGLPVSQTWRGGGSAIFLELGELSEHTRTRKDGSILRSMKGQSTVMIEWSWRVELARSIAFGSDSGQRKIGNGLSQLEGLSVVEIAARGRLPELNIELSGKRWLHSFMTEASQPEWCLFLDRDQWIDSHNGRLRLTTRSDSKMP